MCPRSAAARALVLCYLLLAGSAAAAQGLEQPSAEYELLIRYTGGEHEATAAELLGWSGKQVIAEVTRLQELARAGQACHSCAAAAVWQRESPFGLR